ncbi:MAG: SdrD B-like domain-containing protein [Bacteroidota bacterium]
MKKRIFTLQTYFKDQVTSYPWWSPLVLALLFWSGPMQASDAFHPEVSPYQLMSGQADPFDLLTELGEFQDGALYLYSDQQQGMANDSCASSNLGVLISPQPSYTTCEVSNNGVLEAIAFNGVPGYTYAWSSGQTTAQATGLGVGTYTVTVTDTQGCTATATGTVELHPEGIWLMTSAIAACEGSNSGVAIVSAMLGTEPYSYLWDDGQTTKEATGLAPGSYTVTVTDALGCQATATVDVPAGPAISLFTTASFETCTGSQDATATVIASNGTPPYTYLWSDGQTTDIAVGLSVGTYGVTVTDANGCSAEASQTVELSPEGLWIMTSSTDADCGENNGTAYVGVMTGVPPYTYLWSNGAMVPDPTGLAAGTYTVTVTDSNGCTAEGSVTVNSLGDQLTVSVMGTNVTCDSNGTATAFVTGGTGFYSYAWSNGETTPTIVDLSPGTYTVDVTDDSTGCFGSGSIVIDSECCPALAGGLSPDPHDACLDGGSTTISATPDGNAVVPAGYQTIFVLTSGPGLVIQATNSSPEFTINTAGSYTIHTLIYDPSTLDLSIIQIGVSTGFDVNALLVQGGGMICGALDVTGAGFDVFDSPTVSINGGSSVCPGEPVALSTNPAGFSTYSWTATGGSFDDASSATPTYTMMMPGTYTITVEVSDANGCTASATTEVTINDNPPVSIDPADAGLCPGEALVLSTTASGAGISYNWTATGGSFDDASSATPTYTMMMPGTYTITVEVTYANGCSTSASTTVTINPAPDVSIMPSGDQSVCPGEGLQLTASATGTGLSYSWTATGGSFDDATIPNPVYTMMMPGTYTITVEVTDGNGCTDSASIQVTVTAGPTVSIDPQSAASCGPISVDFSATATGNGLSYLWTATGGSFDDPTSPSPTYMMMMPGTYTITVQVTDENGCTATDDAQVDVFPELGPCTAEVTSSYFEGVDISTVGGSDGSASVMPSGGTAPFSYLWSDGQTTQEATGLSAGTYTVTVTDVNGCSCEASVTLEDPAKLGDFTWEDRDQDGIQENIPMPIGGVNVTLNGTGDNGTPVMRMMTTDADGMYMFDGLLPGTYKVTFETPAGYSPTRPNFGDDTRDSDADPAMGGMTQFVTLMSGEYNPTLDAGFFLCSNLGDFVWFDENHNGIQDPDEVGVEGVQVKLLSAGPDDVFCTADDQLVMEDSTDADGAYLLECVPPGEFIISFMNLPQDWTFTGVNQGGDDSLDSDANPDSGKTDPFTVTYGQPDDLTIDAGIRPICINFDGDGGEIASAGQQPEICPGETPFEIINIRFPTGGVGPIEYLWMSSIVDVPFDTNFWKPIPGAPDAPNFQPGPLTQTTYFIRCVRRLDCPDYLESNTVKVCVKDPADCPAPINGGDLGLAAYVVDGEDVMLEWEMGPELDAYNFFVERSLDGVFWSEIGQETGKRDELQTNYYQYKDNGARLGANQYRIRVVSPRTGVVYSNLVQVIVSDEVMAEIFPNPFRDQITLSPLQDWESDGLVEVFSPTGQLLGSYQLVKGRENVELDLSQIAHNGLYYIRVTYSESGKTKTFRVAKNR